MISQLLLPIKITILAQEIQYPSIFFFVNNFKIKIKYLYGNLNLFSPSIDAAIPNNSEWPGATRKTSTGAGRRRTM